MKRGMWTRRSALVGGAGYLAGALLSVASLGASRKRTEVPRLMYLQSCALAGLPYYAFGDVEGSVVPGCRLELRAEPSNRYDRYAVEVFLPGSPLRRRAKLGYLPRYANHVVSHLLRQDAAIRATVIDPAERSPERRLPGNLGEGRKESIPREFVADWPEVRVRLEMVAGDC